MVGRIIDQYVDAVTQQLPIGVRKSVERKLKDTIYDKLDEYTNGQRAVSRDVRAVLREMGSPDEIVNAYYEEAARRKKRTKKESDQNMEDASNVIFGVSVMLVILGMILLIAGVTSNVFPILLGSVLALSVMLSKMFGPTIEQLDASNKKLKKRKASYGDDDEML